MAWIIKTGLMTMTCLIGDCAMAWVIKTGLMTMT